MIFIYLQCFVVLEPKIGINKDKQLRGSAVSIGFNKPAALCPNLVHPSIYQNSRHRPENSFSDLGIF